ncbi:MAG: ABC transporter ATP-binding protein [Bacillota bacterium]
MAVLSTNSMSIRFGGLAAVSDFSINLEEGELVGLIGPNGAGKTTVFNVLTGIYEPSDGDVHYYGELLCSPRKRAKPYQITALGIARTFQNIRLFKDISVLDNVKVAYHKNVSYGLFSGLFHNNTYVREEAEIDHLASDFLKIFNLDQKKNELAKNLPYGEQRRLEIARALATNPKLLLLDEPAAGMNPQETQQLMELIRFILKKFKLTIFLIEHDMSLVMGVCERIYVLDYGKTIAHGVPEEIRRHPKVIEAYLGEEV